MKRYLLSLWDNVRGSYWFIPLLLVFLSICFSFIFPRLDHLATDYRFTEWVSTTTEAARTTLSSIIGAVISVTGTVFSITIVTLSLTSQQFGPRLLRTFMYDRTTQYTLGIFLSTAVYSALVLRLLEDTDNGPTALHLSSLFAVVLMVLSVGMLISFIHHIAVKIQAPAIVEAVSRDLENAIERFCPDSETENSNTASGLDAFHAERRAQSKYMESIQLEAMHEGYIQGFDNDTLITFADTHDGVFSIERAVGDFIARENHLATFSSRNCPDEEVKAGARQALRNALVVGNRRTPREDFLSLVDELVEIAVRSLSPGINDPFTACQCIDRLSANVQGLARRSFPSADLLNADGVTRLRIPVPSFRFVLDSAFNPIRLYGRESRMVLTRLIESLDAISKCSREEYHYAAIEAHAHMLKDAIPHIPHQDDQTYLADRLGDLMNRLHEQKSGRDSTPTHKA